MKKQLFLLFTMISITILSSASAPKGTRSAGASPRPFEVEVDELTAQALDTLASPRHVSESAPPRLESSVDEFAKEKAARMLHHKMTTCREILKRAVKGREGNPTRTRKGALELRRYEDELDREEEMDVYRTGTCGDIRRHMEQLKRDVAATALSKRRREAYQASRAMEKEQQREIKKQLEEEQMLDGLRAAAEESVRSRNAARERAKIARERELGRDRESAAAIEEFLREEAEAKAQADQEKAAQEKAERDRIIAEELAMMRAMGESAPLL
ncbi:hypothetical protein HN446_01615 [bacterium]|jgi:hypothetical protein|nr:hypothetical protein [bacterium]